MKYFLTIFLLFSPFLGFSQFKLTPEQDSIRKELARLSKLDHQDMLEQLNIQNLRPGRSGNPDGPNPANYDETKANPFSDYPPILVRNNGDTIKNSHDWWYLRRPEIVDAFNEEVYGNVPEIMPKVNWVLLKQESVLLGKTSARLRTYQGQVDNSKYPDISVNIDLQVFLPMKIDKEIPLIMEFIFLWPEGFKMPPSPYTPWEEQVVSRGWAAAKIVPTSFQADNGAGLRSGIIGLVNKGEPRKPNDWGALRAWAWGASKAMDLFKEMPEINEFRVGIAGHSRFGKAAAVTMAFDSRFYAAYISSSGEGGLKPHRRDFGETVENLTGSGEYHWMAGNFIKYGGPKNWNDIPVDAHSLLALIAPRRVFISIGTDGGDKWTDPHGMYLAALKAEPAYKILWHKGLGIIKEPAVGELVDIGRIAFRYHEKGHITGPNWPYFLDFFEK